MVIVYDFDHMDNVAIYNALRICLVNIELLEGQTTKQRSTQYSTLLYKYSSHNDRYHDCQTTNVPHTYDRYIVFPFVLYQFLYSDNSFHIKLGNFAYSHGLYYYSDEIKTISEEDIFQVFRTEHDEGGDVIKIDIVT